MQCRIAALEALAQLVLLILQVQETAAPQMQSILAQVPQLCDNAAVASLSSRYFGTQSLIPFGFNIAEPHLVARPLKKKKKKKKKRKEVSCKI